MLDKEIIGEFIDAAVDDQPRAKELLRQYPQLTDARWIHDETVLHFLAIEYFADAVRFLCELGFNVNTVNEFGHSPLLEVSSLHSNEVAKILLDHGADPNVTSDTLDCPLHRAVDSGNPELVELLLKAGANPEYVTDNGETYVDLLPEFGEFRETIVALFEKYRPS
jgi:ankyrin repeat protein